MTTDLAFLDNLDDGRTPNGAAGRKPCSRHQWERRREDERDWSECHRCGKVRDWTASRRGRNNRLRGNGAELDVARLIPGGRKIGPLGLPWDVEVGTYCRLQVKKLLRRPGPAETRRLIEAIPFAADRLRGFVWVEAAGRGKRGQRVISFLTAEFAQWHGSDFGPSPAALVSMTLDDWAAEFVVPA